MSSHSALQTCSWACGAFVRLCAQGSGGQIVLSGKFYRSEERWAAGPGCCCLVTLLEPVSALLHRTPSMVGCPRMCVNTQAHAHMHTHAHESRSSTTSPAIGWVLFLNKEKWSSLPQTCLSFFPGNQLHVYFHDDAY